MLLFENHTSEMRGVALSPYLHAQIRKLKRDGASCQQLAEKFDLHIATIYRVGFKEKEESRTSTDDHPMPAHANL